MYVCGLYDWGSSSPQAISFLNDASFYLICQCQKISVSSRYSRCLKIAERIFEDEMIVCMTTPCIFMSKITRHNPIQYEGFSSVWIQVDLIILFQIFKTLIFFFIFPTLSLSLLLLFFFFLIIFYWFFVAIGPDWVQIRTINTINQPIRKKSVICGFKSFFKASFKEVILNWTPKWCWIELFFAFLEHKGHEVTHMHKSIFTIIGHSLLL